MNVVLTPQERQQLELWFELLERYQHLPENKMMPSLAVRLLCRRHGYDGVINAMRTHGEDVVVQRGMDTLHEMAKLWLEMTQKYPPAPDEHAGVMEGVRIMQAGSRDAAVANKVFRMLSRMLIREASLKQRKTVQ